MTDDLLFDLNRHSIENAFRKIYEVSQNLNNITYGNSVLVPQKCNFSVSTNIFSSNMSMPLNLSIVFSGRNNKNSSLGYGHKFSFEKEIFIDEDIEYGFFVIDSDSTGIRYQRDYIDDDGNRVYHCYYDNLEAVLSDVINELTNNGKTIKTRVLTFHDIHNSSYIYSFTEESYKDENNNTVIRYYIMPLSFSSKDGTIHTFNYDVNNNFKISSIQTSNYETAYFEYSENNEDLVNRIKIRRLNEDGDEETIKIIRFYYETITIDGTTTPFLKQIKIFHNKNNTEMEFDTNEFFTPNIENKIEFSLTSENNNYYFKITDLINNNSIKYKYSYNKLYFENRIYNLYIHEITEKNKNDEGGIITTLEWTDSRVKMTNNVTNKSRYDYFSLYSDYVDRLNTITKIKNIYIIQHKVLNILQVHKHFIKLQVLAHR